MSRILVIDDSELISNLLNEALSAAGYEVSLAADANQGYQTAIEAQPDLILLDVQLPDIQGFDLMRLLKNRDDLKDVPIIMITGTHSETDHKVKALKAGADDYILKPFEMPELIERIAAVLRRTVRHPGENRPSTIPTDRIAGPVETPGPEPLDSSLRRNDEKKLTFPMGDLSALNRPASAPKPSHPESVPVPLPVTVDQPTLSLYETIYRVMACPEKISGTALPPVTLITFSAILGLSLGGWAVSAGSAVKPAIIGIGVAGLWGTCVAFLVMSCSIMGISMTWREGGRLFSLASIPLLLKLLGGFITALATSLTPFYFTASPALFMKSPSFFLERIDLFELWTLWLIWTMVKQCRGSSPRKAAVIAGVIWPVLAYWQSLWKR